MRKFIWPLAAALMVAVVGANAAQAAPVRYRTEVDTMPGNQYRLCVSQDVVPGLATATNFSVTKRTRQLRVSVGVAGQDVAPPTLQLAVQGNAHVVVEPGQRWSEQPDDTAVLGKTTIKPTVAVTNACFPGQVITARIWLKTALVAGRTYWLVLRMPAVGTVGTIWYAASAAPSTATASRVVTYYTDTGPVLGWYSYSPGIGAVVPAYRVEAR